MTSNAAGANTERWLCCQLRAREHFMVPVGLARRHALSQLITDLWVPPSSAVGRLVPRLRAVYHPVLDGRVSAFNAEALLFEASQTFVRASGWRRIVKRNEWFQSRVVALLKKRSPDATVLFSYSYAARRPFEHAKASGWKTVMVQIDAGLAEERLVASWQSRFPGLEPNWRPAPPEYWARWRAEIDMADRIVVHSRWSRDALLAEGVSDQKLVVVPLAYEPPVEAESFDRTYPDRFSSARPLRVLFLGQVTLRKGALAMLDAARELRNEPVEFLVAGPNALDLSRRPTDDGRIQWLGPVPRGRTAAVYQAADVFLLPTVSDGFGLAQLEAQAWRLPLITTANCGDVVRDGINGTQLREGSGAEVAAVLRRLIAEPATIREMSRAARIDEQHQPDRFAVTLQACVR
jgi:glycosyltransferase involved in cell wall biosynthesis